MKVSVILCVYNEEKFVKKAIDSILYQTLDDFEFIIVNDGSTDNTIVSCRPNIVAMNALLTTAICQFKHYACYSAHFFCIQLFSIGNCIW